jgi:hypothetical protein
MLSLRSAVSDERDLYPYALGALMLMCLVRYFSQSFLAPSAVGCQDDRQEAGKGGNRWADLFTFDGLTRSLPPLFSL